MDRQSPQVLDFKSVNVGVYQSFSFQFYHIAQESGAVRDIVCTLRIRLSDGVLVLLYVSTEMMVGIYPRISFIFFLRSDNFKFPCYSKLNGVSFNLPAHFGDLIVTNEIS